MEDRTDRPAIRRVDRWSSRREYSTWPVGSASTPCGHVECDGRRIRGCVESESTRRSGSGTAGSAVSCWLFNASSWRVLMVVSWAGTPCGLALCAVHRSETSLLARSHRGRHRETVGLPRDLLVLCGFGGGPRRRALDGALPPSKESPCTDQGRPSLKPPFHSRGVRVQIPS